MTKWPHQDNYRANQKRLGMVQVALWVPEDYQDAFQRAADRVRLEFFEGVLQHGDATQIEALAGRNSAAIDNVESFETFIQGNAQLIEGGPRHKTAVALYKRYRKLVQEVHLQRGAVSSELAVNGRDVLREKAKLSVLGQRVRDVLNERDLMTKGGPMLTVSTNGD